MKPAALCLIAVAACAPEAAPFAQSDAPPPPPADVAADEATVPSEPPAPPAPPDAAPPDAAPPRDLPWCSYSLAEAGGPDPGGVAITTIVHCKPFRVLTGISIDLFDTAPGGIPDQFGSLIRVVRCEEPYRTEFPYGHFPPHDVTAFVEGDVFRFPNEVTCEREP